MNKFFQKWRGPAAMLVATLGTLVADAALVTNTPQVQTLGGGPNQTSPAKSGSTDGGTLGFAKFSNPYGVAFDANGNLFIADRSNGKIRKISKVGEADSMTTTFLSKLRSPVGVAVGASNVVYVLTQGDGSLRRYSGTGSLLQTVTGLRNPSAMALTSTGTVFVTELGGTVREVLPDGTINLVASGFRTPRGIALLPSGLLAITESAGHAVYTVNPFTGESVLLAGGNGAGFSDGSGLAARFNQPYGIAAAPNGTLVVADYKNNRLRVVGTNNIVTTLFGMSSKDWLQPFPGWRDGDGVGEDGGVAAARQPVGVAVTPQGTLFVTEAYYDLIRRVTDTGLEGNPVFGTNGTGISTNVVVDGTNSMVVIGTNIVSFGFESGEASSDFVGAAGQSFYAPVTLSMAPGQKAYTFQMSLSATGETGVALDPFQSGFVSKLMKPVAEGFYTPIEPNYVFLNSGINLLGIGWFERFTKTNLYNTLEHDLVTYSIAKNTLFEKTRGKVVLGAYRLSIPGGATNGSSFRIALQNASGTTDGISEPLAVRSPTDGSLGAGALNTIKRVTLASRSYLVGDNVPFRWFNAGDFGDGGIANSDVTDLFQTVAYGLNTAIEDSDLFNAMDSSDGSSATVSFGDDVSINSVVGWDNQLKVDDVWVSFRRSLDPTLKWFARYWSNGVRQVVEVTNTLSSGFGNPPPAAAFAAPRSSKTLAFPATRPSVLLAVQDTLTSPGAVLELPVHMKVTDGYSVRVMMLNVTVEALDGSPAITLPIQFQSTPVFQNPELSDARGVNNYAAAWLDATISGLSGDALLALLTVQVPANAGARAAYRVHFNHFSASPNGAALFDAKTATGLILLSDRSASTWNDGIADAWRLRYFGSIYAAESAPGADADADGVINSVEFQNGTDPTDATAH